jgi:hypothetical protein
MSNIKYFAAGTKDESGSMIEGPALGIGETKAEALHDAEESTEDLSKLITVEITEKSYNAILCGDIDAIDEVDKEDEQASNG